MYMGVKPRVSLTAPHTFFLEGLDATAMMPTSGTSRWGNPSLCPLDDSDLEIFFAGSAQGVPRQRVLPRALLFSGLTVPASFSLPRALAEIEDLIVRGSLVNLGGRCMPDSLPRYLSLLPEGDHDMIRAVNGRTAVRSLAIDVLSVPPGRDRVSFLESEDGERFSLALLEGTRFPESVRGGGAAWPDVWADLVDPEVVLLPSEAATIIINIIRAKGSGLNTPADAGYVSRVKTFNRVQAAIFSLPHQRSAVAAAVDDNKRWFAREADAIALERTERETQRRIAERKSPLSLAEIDTLVEQFCEIALQELR